MQTRLISTINRKILAILLALSLIAGVLCLDISRVDAKGNLSTDDSVKNVLIYVKNSAGDEVLIAQVNVSDMLTYLNDNIETHGKVHNYSILDTYVTPVHQEAQGFTVKEMLDYAIDKSTLANKESLGLDFNGNDSVCFWEIDGGGFDAADTYTYTSLYGVQRYNFPVLYGNWDYTKKAYAGRDAIWMSRQEEQPLLSIKAYSQRYIESALNGTNQYNMENYFDGQRLLDTARTVRIMLPMTEDEFDNQISTAMNSRYGICYILFDMETDPVIAAGKVAKPTYTVIDGDGDENDKYDAGYWYFTLSCATEGAVIYYNDNSVSSYMPTAIYTPGQEIKVKKNANTASTLKFRAVKEGCSDAGVQTASSNQEETPEEEIPSGADIWDGTSVDTSWYNAGQASLTISTGAELAGLATLVNDSAKTGAVNFAGQTITLGNNIHLNGHNWEPIGTDQGIRTIKIPDRIDTDYYYSFNGNFVGNGHTIGGLAANYVKATGAYCGLFGKLENAKIENLTVSGSASASNGSGVGGIAGIAVNSVIENCTSKVRVSNDNGSGAGGIAGYSQEGSLKNCVNYGTVTANCGIGGIAGSGFTIENCVNYGKVTGTGSGVGGITGGLSTSMSNCQNYGEIMGGSNVGGITGNSGSSSTIQSCTNYAAVTAIASGGGGITGSGNEGSNLNNCLNLGTVSSLGNESINRISGGIAGSYNGTITACVNYGTIKGNNYAGGVVGSSDRVTVTASYNRGNVISNDSSAAAAIGSLMGSAGDNANISKCYDVSGLAVFDNVSGVATLSRIYYLEGGVEMGNNPGADRAGINSKTETEMKSASLVSTLGQYNANGNGSGDGYFVYNPGGYPALYWQQTRISFAPTPAAAAVVVKNSDGTTIEANPDGTYTLVLGETYTYEVCAEGYLTQSGSFTVTGAENIVVVLEKDQITTSGPNQIILSWTDNPSTSQTIIWNNNSGQSEVVQYVAEASYTDEGSFSSANQAAATSKAVGYDEKAKTYYEATMTGLNPATKYYYRVGSDAGWSNVYSFTTAPSTAQTFSYMYMGDVQYNTTAAAEYPTWGTLLASAYAANPNIAFGLMGGDMVQSGSDINDWTYFLSYASDVFSQIPLMTTIGNHESNFTGGKAKFHMDILALPTNGPAGFKEEFYSFDYGTVHVTVLNSWALSNEQKLDETQKTVISDWITADLAAAQGAKFRIVMLHHPAYALANDTVSAAVLADWVPLLEAGQVNLVLCGHQHVYSRSYPMRAGKIDYANGITYVMGNSGQKFYSTADTAYQEKTIFSKSTYQIININGNTLSLSTFDSAGNLLDSWSTTTQSTTLIGDVDGDGDVDLDDVDAIYRAVLNSDDYNSLMDINNDGVVDMRDTQLVLKIHLDNAA